MHEGPLFESPFYRPTCSLLGLLVTSESVCQKAPAERNDLELTLHHGGCPLREPQLAWTPASESSGSWTSAPAG